jgi:serine/threonine-protein kinase
MALLVGQPFGNYRIVRLIGEGGFGEVYLAENPLIERRAAIKVLHGALAQDAELVRRFLNEARAASAIRHPNIIEVFDAGITPEGAPYILMEFLEGASLHKRLADVGRLALPQALTIASQAGSALAAAHAAGIVHRDLKPENLFLVSDPGFGGERVKVLDFGIAKVKAGTGSGGSVRTQTGIIMGSPAYMSPEQCRDSADVDPRADIYSLATIVYEMLAGSTPHVAFSATELLVKHLTETPRPLRELAPEVPANVEAAIARALARSRADRFDNMDSFLQALGTDASAAVLGRQPPPKGLPAVQGEPASVVKRTAILPEATPATRRADASVSTVERIAHPPADTTFSRTTGELGAAEESDEILSLQAPRRRRLLLGLGGMVVAGLALFLLVRPDPGSKKQPEKAIPSVTATNTAVPTEFRPPEPPMDAGVDPSRAEAGAAASVVSRARTDTKTGLYPKTRTSVGAKTKTHSGVMAKTDLGTNAETKSGKKTKTDVGTPNCNPNFYLDAQGDKHFRPECFENHIR